MAVVARLLSLGGADLVQSSGIEDTRAAQSREFEKSDRSCQSNAHREELPPGRMESWGQCRARFQPATVSGDNSRGPSVHTRSAKARFGHVQVALQYLADAHGREERRTHA